MFTDSPSTKPAGYCYSAMITQRDHHVIQFFERNEATAVLKLVVVDCICKFSDFRSCMTLTITKLTALNATGRCSAVAAASINELTL